MRSIAMSRFLLFCGLSGVMTKPVEFNVSKTLSGFFEMLQIQNIRKEQNLNANFDSPKSYDTLQIIRQAGYPAESHVIETEDGYLLTLHRIPGGQNSTPVLLQHGFLCSSADWVLAGKNRGLAFIMADQGYDVWMGNIRGNTYSRAHVSLSPSNEEFWNFSFHKMGMYDIPAMISYITSKRSQPLHTYVGHSMGTTMFYVMASNLPRVAEKVKAMISLAPVAFMKHIRSPVRCFARYGTNYNIVKLALGEHGEFLPQKNTMIRLAKLACRIKSLRKKVCANVLFLIAGFDEEQFDYDLLPVILNHDPAGASIRTLVHYNQEMESGRFCQYDYGKNENLVIYNATEPPDYNLHNITVPIALFYADNDWLTSEKDVVKLKGNLSNLIDIYKVPYPPFNHLDFIWARNAPELVYKRVLEIMRNVTDMTYDNVTESLS